MHREHACGTLGVPVDRLVSAADSVMVCLSKDLGAPVGSVIVGSQEFIAKYSAKLLKKQDQCKVVYVCSHLFWVEDEGGVKDGERVLLCLKRAIRIANAAQQMANVTGGNSGPATLFVEILNKYIYFFEKGNRQITSNLIRDLIELIAIKMQSESATQDPSVDAFFASTLRYIQFQKKKGGAMGEKYDVIQS